MPSIFHGKTEVRRFRGKSRKIHEKVLEERIRRTISTLNKFLSQEPSAQADGFFYELNQQKEKISNVSHCEGHI